MPRSSPEPPFYGRSPTESLHTLKNDWGCQKTHLAAQCQALVKHLDAAIAATREAAPERSENQPFNPNGSARKRRSASKIDPSNMERLLEDMIWRRWRGDGELVSGVPGLWRELVGIQVPLFASRHKAKWGHIDLLGLSDAGAPVVVELKKGESREIPLRPVLEAAAYAVALRKNWGRFAPQLGAQFKTEGRQYSPCANDKPFQCVVLAPIAYWKYWLADRAVTADAWRQFGHLVRALGKRGYPVRFGRIDDTASPLSAEKFAFPAVG